MTDTHPASTDTLELRRLAEELVRHRRAYAESEDGSVEESEAFIAIAEASAKLDEAIGWPEDIILALLDRLEAAEGRAWQPIETAPRDGSDILAYSPNGREIMHWNQGFGGPGWLSDSGAAQHDYWNYVGEKPTHWMPLPPAPEAEAMIDHVLESGS